jgi:GDP-mannose transporter
METTAPWAASLAFSCAGIGMILTNKGVMVLFPFSGLLLLLQTGATLLFLYLSDMQISKAWKWSNALSWTPCSVLFAGNLITSLQALKYIGVPTFTVLRNTQPCLTLLLELILFGRRPRLAPSCWLLLVFLGSSLYAYEDLTYSDLGYFWSILHIISMSLYLVLVKTTGQSLNLNATAMSLYNNALALPLFFALSMSGLTESGRDGKDAAPDWLSTVARLAEIRCAAVVLLSCVGGFLVSVTAFRAQQVRAASAFQTLAGYRFPLFLIIMHVRSSPLFRFDTDSFFTFSPMCSYWYQ